MSKRGNLQPYWRPDFKIGSTLPDIKVVRTGFIINFIAVVCALFVIIMLLQNEYRIFQLNRSVAGIETQIQGATAENASLLKQSEHFRKTAKEIEELQHFYEAPFAANELLVELARLKPNGLLYSAVNFSDTVILTKVGKSTSAKMGYNIRISGQVRDFDILTAFKAALEASSLLQAEGFIVNVNEQVKSPDLITGVVSFDVSITLRAGTAPVGKGGAK